MLYLVFNGAATEVVGWAAWYSNMFTLQGTNLAIDQPGVQEEHPVLDQATAAHPLVRKLKARSTYKGTSDLQVPLQAVQSNL